MYTEIYWIICISVHAVCFLIALYFQREIGHFNRIKRSKKNFPKIVRTIICDPSHFPPFNLVFFYLCDRKGCVLILKNTVKISFCLTVKRTFLIERSARAMEHVRIRITTQQVVLFNKKKNCKTIKI